MPYIALDLSTMSLTVFTFTYVFISSIKKFHLNIQFGFLYNCIYTISSQKKNLIWLWLKVHIGLVDTSVQYRVFQGGSVICPLSVIITSKAVMSLGVAAYNYMHPGQL